MSKKELIVSNIAEKPKTTYDSRLLFQQYKKYIELVNYDFENGLIVKNIGDEARTFHVMNKSRPLLSPSRLLKPFVEHKYWLIPKKNLLKPRIMGQIIHHLIELSINFGEIVKFSKEELINRFPTDYEIMVDNWDVETINSMISDINHAVKEIINFLAMNNIKVLKVEKHVANFQYHGYIDLVCLKTWPTSNKRIPLIIDLKVSSMDEMQPSWITQLAIYWELLERTCGCAILLYDRNLKKCNLLKINVSQLKEHIQLWNTLMTIHRKE